MIKNVKPKVNPVVSAFSNYTNAVKISNISLFGLKGINYIKYEKERLINCLRINRNMKILITVSLKLVDI